MFLVKEELAQKNVSYLNQNSKKEKYINKYINTGNNSTYHEPLSDEWIERRS